MEKLTNHTLSISILDFKLILLKLYISIKALFCIFLFRSGGKYGFSDRVIDGMTVVVNSVVINFNSPAFQASFQVK